MAGKRHRGRSRTIREATAAKASANEGPIFDPAWFSGDPDIETETKGAIKPQKMASYPPYLPVRLGRWKIMSLVKGTICQRILRLYAEELDMIAIAQALGTTMGSDGLRAADVESIIEVCEALGLKGVSPLETQDWENTPIEGWWEQSYCEELARNQPIGPDVTGYDSEQGWWANKSVAENRDWAWFAEAPDIGPGRQSDPR